MREGLAEAGRTLLYIVALVVGIGAAAHLLGWVFMRRRTVQWVWQAWNVLGTILVIGGAVAMGYGWLGLGLQTPWGSTVSGLGLLFASAGIWMLVPV